MANSLGLTSNAVAGLGDFQFTIVDDGLYFLGCQSTIPHDPGSALFSDAVDPAQSALQIVLKQNSTTKVTVGGSASNPTPSQPSLSASTYLQCVAGDVLHVVLSSANAIDNQPNTVKSNVNIFRSL